MGQIKALERLQIETLIEAGHKAPSIAKQLGRNKSSIYREINRNTYENKYCHNAAQQQAEQRRKDSKTSILTEDNWTIVRALIQQKWSPEQISGWLKENPLIGFYVSDQWIYEYIYRDRGDGGNLYENLRRAGKPYKLGGPKVYRGKIKDRVEISSRPDIINKRLRIGDWEVDSVIGKMNQSSIVTIVERLSRYTAIIKVSSKEADVVAKAIIDRMSQESLPIYSITGDNGTEFSNHKPIAQGLGVDFYFTHPYSSWEKGTNENTNGLIRQYFPKGTDFSNISESLLKDVEQALNDRQRKNLKYKTPSEIIGIC